MLDDILYSMAATLFVLFSCVIGGIIFRWRGGGEPMGLGKYMPRPIHQILFSLPYAYIAFSVFDVWTASVISVLTVIMVMKGHGRNMDLGYADSMFPNARPEWYEPLINKLYGKISNYWYDFLGLIVSGLTYTLPLGLFLCDPRSPFFWAGALLLLSGALKAVAYKIGRWANKWADEIDDTFGGSENSDVIVFDSATSYGEFLTGFFLWGAAAFYIAFHSFKDLGAFYGG